MRRREFAKLVAATAAWPITSSPWQKPKPVIGYLSARPLAASALLLDRIPAGTERSGVY